MREDGATTSASACLETDGLSVGYDGATVVADVNLHVSPGRIVTLVGPNGSGKSTLLRTVAGLQDRLGGVVCLQGKELRTYSPRSLSLVRSVLLTDHPRPELLTCEDVVAAGRYSYTGRLGVLGENDRAQVRDAMELLSVWDLRAKDYLLLSDGQRQRILLARALCQEPRLLVLDEPTSYLDIKYQLELCAVLRMLAQERSVGIVMSLHELLLVRLVSDWLVCVRDHGIWAQGTPTDIFASGAIDDLFDLAPGTYEALLSEREPSERPLPTSSRMTGETRG